MAFSSIVRHARRPGVQTIMLAMATGLSQVITALISILVARDVTTSALGLATVAMSMAMMLVGVLDFGSNQLWLRDFARDQTLRDEMSDRLMGKLAVTGAVAAVALAVFLLVPGLSLWWSAPIYGFWMQVEQTVQVPLRARGKVPTVALSMFVNRLVALVAVVGLGMLGMGAMRLVLALALGSLAACVQLWFAGARQDMALHLRRKSPWKGAQHFGVYTLSNNLQALDAPLLGIMATNSAVGLYGAVNRWTAPITLLGSAFSSASVPHVAAAGSLIRGWRAIKKSAVLLVGALVATALTALLAKPVVHLLLGPGYDGAAPVLQILAVAMGVVIFNQPAAMLLQSTGHERAVSLALPVSLAIQLGAIVLLAPHFGAVGASLAMLLAQLTMAAFLAFTLMRVLRHERRPRRALLTADEES